MCLCMSMYTCTCMHAHASPGTNHYPDRKPPPSSPASQPRLYMCISMYIRIYICRSGRRWMTSSHRHIHMHTRICMHICIHTHTHMQEWEEMGEEREEAAAGGIVSSLPVPPPPTIWRCAACTFDNSDATARVCSMCGTARPPAGATVGGGSSGASSGAGSAEPVVITAEQVRPFRCLEALRTIRLPRSVSLHFRCGVLPCIR